MSLDGSAMHPYQLLDDGQPDAQAALRAIQGVIRLHEEVKDVRQDLRIDSRNRDIAPDAVNQQHREGATDEQEIGKADRADLLPSAR